MIKGNEKKESHALRWSCKTNQLTHDKPAIPNFTRSQALPGNADPEALPPIFTSEAEPLEGSQAEPRNQLILVMKHLL